jgi:hypothetical protein
MTTEITTDRSFPAQPPPPPRTSSSGLPFAVIFTALHALLCCGLVVLLLPVVARAERVFRDFQMRLPDATVVVIAVGRWFALYWYVVPPFFLAWLVLVGYVLAVLHRRRRGLGWVLALLLLVLPLLAGAFVLFTVLTPMMKLMEGLNR